MPKICAPLKNKHCGVSDSKSHIRPGKRSPQRPRLRDFVGLGRVADLLYLMVGDAHPAGMT